MKLWEHCILITGEVNARNSSCLGSETKDRTIQKIILTVSLVLHVRSKNEPSGDTKSARKPPESLTESKLGMTEELRQRLRYNHALLINAVRAKEILVFLCGKHVLTETEYKELWPKTISHDTMQATSCYRMSTLLHLLEIKDDRAFYVFCMVLEATGNHFLSLELASGLDVDVLDSLSTLPAYSFSSYKKKVELQDDLNL